jgi:hypothetical protein
MIDLEHQKKFEEVWDKGDYRLGSTAQRLVKRILEVIPETASINDYGSGTGRAEAEILKTRPDQEIRMIDIAPNAPEFNFLENINITFHHADLSFLNGVPHADWGMCINTLMTVQLDKLDTILSEIRRTCDNLFFEAYDFDDVRLGRNYTTVKMDKIEWYEKLSDYWNRVKFEPSPESDHRYIFICRS